MKKNKKIAIITIATAIMSVAIVWFYRSNKTSGLLDLVGDGNGYDKNQRRSYDFIFPRKRFTPVVADATASFSFSNRSLNNRNARWLVQNYDSIVTPISVSLNLPRFLIYAIMLVESGGLSSKANFDKAKYQALLMQNSSGALGPMQVKPITATETVQIASTKGLITDYHITILQNAIGSKRTAEIFAKKPNTKATYVNNKIIAYSGPKSELNAPSLNILVASLKLVNLIDNYQETNLHQVFYAYNQGDRTVLAYGLKKYTSVQSFLSATTGEGKEYIKRMLGKNGAIDIIINDLNITT